MDEQSQQKPRPSNVMEYQNATEVRERSATLAQAEDDAESERLSITFNARRKVSAVKPTASPGKKTSTISQSQQASGSLRIRPQTAASIQVLFTQPLAETRNSRQANRR